MMEDGVRSQKSEVGNRKAGVGSREAKCRNDNGPERPRPLLSFKFEVLRKEKEGWLVGGRKSDPFYFCYCPLTLMGDPFSMRLHITA
jgi:hypothetical protein